MMIFDDEIDVYVKPVVEQLNQMGYMTTSSCQGHPFGGHIYFKSDGYPEWARSVMQYVADKVEDVGGCLGCLKLEIGCRTYMDCSHTLISYGYISLNPRHDGDWKDKDIKYIWDSVFEALVEYEGG